MLARWYLLLGQFLVTFEYRPGAVSDRMLRQCDQCRRPDCPVSSSDSQVADLNASSVLLDQPFASSEMGDSMAVLADVVSVGSAGSSSGSRADCPTASGMDVTSAPLSSAVVPFSHSVLRVDVSCDLHPFFAHKLDSGPIQLMTIAHAFNYRVGYSGWTFP